MLQSYAFWAAMVAGGMMGCGSLAWSQSAAVPPPANPIQKSEDSFHRLTQRMPDSATQPANNPDADANAIRQALGGVTQAALTQSGFEDLIMHFSAADRSRLSRNKQVITSHPALDTQIAEFRDHWQARYNQEFKINDKDAVYGAAFASIKQGYEPEGARLAGERIAPSENPLSAAHDEIRDRDQKIATVSIAGSSTAPAIEVPMVLESSGWKIDIPDTYSMQAMHDALLSQIAYLDQHRDQLPADVNDACRMVTQRILMAVLNIESPTSGDMNKPLPPEPAQSPTADRILDPTAVK